MMLRIFSSCSFVFVILLLGSCFSLASCNDDSSEEAAQEHVEEPVTEADSDEEVSERRAAEDGDSDVEECKNPSNATKEKCCKDTLEIDSATMKCFVLHQKKMPKEDEKNPQVLVKFFSCLIECVYKAKKYIGKGDTLNMKMIKSDANKQYKNSPREKEYMIEMYEHCERHAAVEWGNLKKNPAARVIFTGSCKPYFMWVFMCVLDYGKISCPHFKWKGKKDNVLLCEEMKGKCEQLVNG